MGKSVERVLITNVETDTREVLATAYSSIASGDIFILDRTMSANTIAAASTADVIYLAMGISGEGSMKAILSNPIKVSNVTKASLSSYVAPVEATEIIGYNGTSGDFPTINNNSEYSFIIAYLNDDRALQQRQSREVFNYTTSSSATKAELAFALASAASQSSAGITCRKVEVLSNGTFTAFAGNLTVTNQSKVMTVANGADLPAVGEYLRIGGATGGFPVYKVSRVIDATNFEVSFPYQGSTATVLAANVGTMTVATAYGIKTTGLPVTANTIDLYEKNDFSTSIAEVDGPSIPEFTKSTDTGINYGVGFWQQVKDKEFLASGYLGVNNRIQFPGNQLNPPTHAVVGNTYNMVTIEHFSEERDGLGSTHKNPIVTTIAFYSSSAPTTSAKQTAVLANLATLGITVV